MKISITMDGEKRSYGFNIRHIIHDFHSKEEPGEQLSFMEKKMAEIALISGIGRKNINLVSRIKRFYLVHCKHLDFILYGLYNMAKDNYRVLEGS